MDLIKTTLPSGARVVRFDNLDAIYEYDDWDKHPGGLGMRHQNKENYLRNSYFRDRQILTPEKLKLIAEVQKNLEADKEFLELIYKEKSAKRKYVSNKFGGNLSVPAFAKQSEKVFQRNTPGARKQTLNMAFQVGTFQGGDYGGSFAKILKTVLTCQAMGIHLNIDVFDSDTDAIANGPSYVICNIAKSHEKLNFRDLLASSHPEFFNVTLFNGYTASGNRAFIGTFLSESRIQSDLAEKYDVIGGNLLNENGEKSEMISKVLKIGLGR